VRARPGPSLSEYAAERTRIPPTRAILRVAVAAPARASASAHLAATLEAGVIINVRNCDGAWRPVDCDGFKGYIEQVRLWGVYPNEKIE